MTTYSANGKGGVYPETMVPPTSIYEAGTRAGPREPLPTEDGQRPALRREEIWVWYVCDCCVSAARFPERRGGRPSEEEYQPSRVQRKGW